MYIGLKKQIIYSLIMLICIYIVLSLFAMFIWKTSFFNTHLIGVCILGWIFFNLGYPRERREINHK